MQNFGPMQKRYGVDYLIGELENFKTKQSKVEDLQKCIGKLLRMHSASRDHTGA